MKLPNGYGSVTKMSGRRRNPWVARKTDGYELDPEKGTKKQKYIIIGYAPTKAEGLKMLADLQFVIDDCDKNYPTFKKIKVLFN
ncbi:MAG: hypothetical protein SPG59_02620 [Blautia sp.]|nr:hypothetical protein [Blautia sp.]